MTPAAYRHRSHVVIERVAADRTQTIFDRDVDVPRKTLSIGGPCRVVVTNHGPEVVVVDVPSSSNGYTAHWVVPSTLLNGQVPPELRRHEIPSQVVLDRLCFSLDSTHYSVSLRVDNLLTSLDTFEKEYAGRRNAAVMNEQDYKRQRGEIQLVCRVQAEISEFPQGSVRACRSDPPDIVITPPTSPASNDGIDELGRGGVGVEVSELVDQRQHEMFLRARAIVDDSVKRWRRKAPPGADTAIRIDYGVTADLIARIQSGSGPKDKRTIMKEAVNIIDCCVSEFRRLGANEPVKSGLIPYARNPDELANQSPEVIDVRVSASNTQDCETHYYSPVSGLHWSNDRFFNVLGDDVTLDATRLQGIIFRKARKINKKYPTEHPFSSLVLYLTGEHFPAGSAKSGSFGILRVDDEHPDRCRRFDISPFSRIYIRIESSNYMIDAKSGRFTEVHEL